MATTFRVLSRCDSAAAGRVLVRAMDSPHPLIGESALAAVLNRRDSAGHLDLLRRWDSLDPRWRALIKQNCVRLGKTLREALQGSDIPLCTNACHAAVWLEQFDLIPVLVSIMGDQLNPNGDLAAQTLLALADRLYERLATAHDDADRRDPQIMRQHVVGHLNTAVQRFMRHKSREVLEAFLTLARREDVVLCQILQDPLHHTFTATMDVLHKSARPGVMRLLLSFLDDPHAPSAGLSAAGNRTDPEFIRHLLRRIGREPSSIVKQNLKRISSIAWLRTPEGLLDSLDDAGQHGAVQQIMASGVPRPQAFAILEHLLNHGKQGGRRAAAEALADFSGSEANALSLRALEDPDPLVQAAIVVQLRRRGIPGALTRLVELLDSPHVAVRQAARKGLAEFTFKRFVGAFDMLDDDVRRSTGLLVRKVDPQAIPLLDAELQSPARSRRLRGLAIARAIDAVADLEARIIQLVRDEDHMVRAEAAAALEAVHSEPSRQALAEALSDRSEMVQEAARKSLTTRHQFEQWRTTVNDPRD